MRNNVHQLTRGGTTYEASPRSIEGHLNRLEGANCADLPPFVIDKFFYCDGSKEHFNAMWAKAICRNCVVLEECRSQAVNAPVLQERGIVGGVSAREIRRARAWRNYEQGSSENVPRFSRPGWLPMADAAHEVEQLRTENDPDE